jgi:hypothetical protein
MIYGINVSTSTIAITETLDAMADISLHFLTSFAESTVLRISGPKRNEVTGGWRKLHEEELHNLYSSPSIIRMIKAGRTKWAGYVACMRNKKNAYRILV